MCLLAWGLSLLAQLLDGGSIPVADKDTVVPVLEHPETHTQADTPGIEAVVTQAQ